MITESDTKISEAKDAINKAAKALAEVMTGDNAMDEYTTDFQDTVRRCLNLILDVKIMLHD